MRISDEVLSVLSASRVSGHALYLPGQLDRTLYLKVNKVLLSGEVEIPKDEYDFFPTPPDVAKMLVDAAEVSPGMVVLEPSAGNGAIVKQIFATADVAVVCFEISQANCVELNKLGDTQTKLSVVQVDFLSATPREVYDRVIMNPPFSRQQDIHHVSHAIKFLRPGGRLVAVMSAGVLFRENSLTKHFRNEIAELGGTITPLPAGSFKASGTMVNTVMVVF